MTRAGYGNVTWYDENDEEYRIGGTVEWLSGMSPTKREVRCAVSGEW